MCTNPQLIRNRSKIVKTFEPFPYVSRYNRFAPMYNVVPCGKCLECLKKSQNEWMIRLNEEIRSKGKAVFVTLTYRPEDIPVMVDKTTGEYKTSLCVSDVQKWIKRFRINSERAKLNLPKWSYFLCGEYGTHGTHRPHYHVLFFGLSVKDISLALADWDNKYGFVKSENVGAKAKERRLVAKYVSKYAVKGIFKSKDNFDGSRVPEFRLMSKGLGKEFIERRAKFILCKLLIDKNIVKYDKSSTANPAYYGYSREYLERIRLRCNYPVGDITYSLPRYYKIKVFPPKSNLAYAYQNFLFDKSLELRDNKLEELRQLHPDKSYGEISFMLDEQEISQRREREFSARESLNRFYKRSKF